MSVGHVMPPEMVAEIKRLHSAGLAQGVIAKRLGVSRRSVCRKLRSLDMSTSAPTRWTGVEDLQLATLLVDGLTYPQISEKMGRSLESIRSRAKVLGIGVSPKKAAKTAIAANQTTQGGCAAYVPLLMREGGFPTLDFKRQCWIWPKRRAA